MHKCKCFCCVVLISLCCGLFSLCCANFVVLRQLHCMGLVFVVVTCFHWVVAFFCCVAACFHCVVLILLCYGLFSLCCTNFVVLWLVSIVLWLVFVVVAACFHWVVHYWATVVLRLRCMLTWSRRPGVSIWVRCFMSWRFASGLQRNRLIWEQNVDQVQKLLRENGKKHSLYPPLLFVACFQVVEAIHQAGHTLLKGVQSVMLRVVTSKAVPQTMESISY